MRTGIIVIIVFALVLYVGLEQRCKAQEEPIEASYLIQSFLNMIEGDGSDFLKAHGLLETDNEHALCVERLLKATIEVSVKYSHVDTEP